MSQTNSAAPPGYDADISKTIQNIQTDAAHDHAGTNDILVVLKQHQLKDFSTEINDTMKKTLSLQQTFQAVSMSIQASEAQVGPIATDFREHQKTYSEILWDGREAATKTAGAKCLDGFVNVNVPYLILNPEVPDADVIDELEQSLRNMPKIDVIGKNYGGFPALIEALKGIETRVVAKTSTQLELSSEITHKSQSVHRIEEKLKTAHATVKSLVPESLRAIGLDEGSPIILLFIAMCIRSLVRMILAQEIANRNPVQPAPKVTTEPQESTYKAATSPQGGHHVKHTDHKIGVQKLLEAQRNVESFEADLAKAQQELEVMIDAEKTKTKKEAAQWLSTLTEVRNLISSLEGIEGCFDVLARITDVVSLEYSTYLTFLKGSDSQNQAKRELAKQRIKSASAIYKSLQSTLVAFASTVTPAPTS